MNFHNKAELCPPRIQKDLHFFHIYSNSKANNKIQFFMQTIKPKELT